MSSISKIKFGTLLLTKDKGIQIDDDSSLFDLRQLQITIVLVETVADHNCFY